MPTYTQENRPVRIQTPFGENVLLIKSLNGRESLGRGFHYELELLSEDHELDYKRIIGQNVTILVDKSNKEPRYFNGFVSRFAQTKYERKLAVYRATVVPWLWFLTRSSDCRIFQKMTIPEILKQVFQDFGFTDVIDRLNGEYRQWDYCVQYRETAYDFVSRLMEEEGIYHYFKHEAGKHSLVLCDSPASHKQFAGYEQLLYRQSSVLDEETLRTWEVQFEVESGAYAARDFDFTAPKRNTTASSFRDRSHGQSQLEQFDYLGEQTAFTEGERYTKLRLEELQSQHETYVGEGGARGVCTGVRFVLKGHPRADFNTEYLTTGVEYCIQANPFETAEAQGEEFKFVAKVSAIQLEEQFRAPRITPKPIVHGPQSATVVGPAGQKIYTDKYGRVKVQFHWDRLGQKDENSSCWIRVSQGWAGKPKTLNWGDMAIPHIGDEVLVECLEGDPDRPIITGRVYNQANMPPLTLPAHKNKRIWQDDFGNRLVFDASPGDEHIRLYSPHHKSGLTLGRSAVNVTESNAVTANMGSTTEAFMGSYNEIIVGLCSESVLGVNLAANIGETMAFNFANQFGASLGAQCTVSSGYKKEISRADDNKVCKKNYILSAGEVLNLVGGDGHAAGTSVMRADQKTLELTVGDTLQVEPADLDLGWKSWALRLGLIPLMTVASAATAGALVNANVDVDTTGETASGGLTSNDDATTNDALDSNNTPSQQAQNGVVAGTAALQVLTLLIMLGLDIHSLKHAKETKHVAHDPKNSPFAARLLLTKKSQEALLQANKSVNIWGNGTKSRLALDSTTKMIKVDNQAGDVLIQSGTTSITLKKGGDIAISGPNVKVTGNFDVAGGALSVTGVGVPTVSDLQAAVTKLENADLDESIARTLLEMEVAFDRLATMENKV